MATINIGAANADDAFYRYKMPKLVAKIEGRGNGIKTNIVNNVDIAKALERNPECFDIPIWYPTTYMHADVLKYFGCELGAQTNFDKATGTSIVNGAHDSKKLMEILEGFIKKFVQCYSCGNPETHIKIKKELLHLKCKACGFVSDVDPRHKLNTFILKNPPENKLKKEELKLKKAEEERLKDAEKAEKREKKEKKEKEKDKKDKKDKKEKSKSRDLDDISPDKEDSKVESEAEEEEEEEEDGVVWMTDTSAEAAARRAQEQLTAATAAMVTQGNIEAEQEEARKKAEKEAKKKAEAEAKAKAEAEAAELAAKAEALRLAQVEVDSIKDLINEKAKPSAVAAAVKALTPSGGLAGKMRIFVEALFGSAGDDKLADLAKTNKAVVAALASDAPAQLALCIGLEHFLSVTCPERVKETPLLLKALYDLDLADEDVLVAWAGKADAAKILGLTPDQTQAMRKAAAPLIEWLQEDEDEDEDDDEE